MDFNKNSVNQNKNSHVMYVDMNSYFASCEEQLVPALRGKPFGVCPYPGIRAVAIAVSKEAKKYGIKTGMLFCDAKLLCPNFEIVPSRPVEYRRIHVKIMNILREYFEYEDIIPKSIDEAVINLTPYTHIYKNFDKLAFQIKNSIKNKVGEFLTCSIGISGNVFLAKLATEMQKPDGLITLTPDNLDKALQSMKLTDLPGIARGNAKKLHRAGINTPVEMRQASEITLRKALGGIVGNYWYYRLNFMEVDMHTSSYKNMAAARSLSPQTRSSIAALQSMLISLCTRLEQRMVKQDVFCTYVTFYTIYYDSHPWKTDIKLNPPVQDAMELLHHIQNRIDNYELLCTSKKILRKEIKMMGVTVGNFVISKNFQYSLFDNRADKDKLRKVMYNIKDKYGKNIVRKASETIEAGQMKDAIGFGSVKDMYQTQDIGFNKYLLEDDAEMTGHL